MVGIPPAGRRLGRRLSPRPVVGASTGGGRAQHGGGKSAILHLAPLCVFGDWGGRRSMGYANELDPSHRPLHTTELDMSLAGIQLLCIAHGAPAAPASNEQRKRGLNVRVLAALGALSLAALAPVRLVAADPPSHARLLAAVPPLTPLAARTALVRPHRGVNARKSTRRPRTTQSRLASLGQSCARLWV